MLMRTSEDVTDKAITVTDGRLHGEPSEPGSDIRLMLLYQDSDDDEDERDCEHESKDVSVDTYRSIDTDTDIDANLDHIVALTHK